MLRKERESRSKKTSKKRRVSLFTLLIPFACLVGYFVILAIKNQDQKVIVQNGEVEVSNVYNAFCIKQESVIDIDLSRIVLPIISDGARVSKNQVIAVYKGIEYEKYKQELEKKDKEILGAMENLPKIYSKETQSIDKEILKELQNIQKNMMYSQIQDSKVKVSELMNKRAKEVAINSPEGAKVKELLESRNAFEQESKKSKDNIVSKQAGIIVYKTDELETLLSSKNIDTLDSKTVKEKLILSKKGQNGIKVVNNYKAYLMIENVDVSANFIQIGKDYEMRVLTDEKKEIKGRLYKVIKNEITNTSDVILEITDNIEIFADKREIEVEIIWWTEAGLMVPNEAIQSKDKVNYVTLISYGKYIEIPVIIEKQNETNSIITNISNEQAENKSIYHDIRLYDQIVIRNSNREGKEWYQL